jgi:citrate synthase
MRDDPFLTAREAAEELGVTLPTLYAYVSRGLVRSEQVGNAKQRRYHREDVQTLKKRKEFRQEPEKVAESSLHWGVPVLESGITQIVDGRLYYRGHDACRLAEGRRIEEVAALIWLGDLAAELPSSGPVPGNWRALLDRAPALSRFEAFQVAVPLAGAADWQAYDLRPASVIRVGTRLLSLLGAIASSQDALEGSMAQALQSAWTPDAPEAAALFDAALILCADHELNVSTFTARCVASAGATPYAAVGAGLAALQGVKHGGHTERVDALFEEAVQVGARAALTGRLKRGELIPSFFGQPLYPQGDPRCKTLMQLVAQARPDSPAVRLATELMASAEEILGEPPTIDFGLVTLTRALELPRGTALSLFAMGRTVGWIGHILEQYQSDRLVRPRARYVGVPPIEM